MREREGIVNAIIGDFETAESGEIGAGAKFLADVFGEGANIGAGAAVDTDFEFRVIVIQNINRVNFDLAAWNFEVLAFSSEFVGALTVNLDSGEARWGLFYLANETIKHRGYVFLGTLTRARRYGARSLRICPVGKYAPRKSILRCFILRSRPFTEMLLNLFVGKYAPRKSILRCFILLNLSFWISSRRNIS